MSLEIVDELMTPGCPQCAIKHLSAALSYSAETFAKVKRQGVVGMTIPGPGVLLARAYINLGEVRIGYRSHLWFAVGLLQRAEEDAQHGCYNEIATVARAARLILEQDGLGGVVHAMGTISDGIQLGPATMEAAHVVEAQRELPVEALVPDVADICGVVWLPEKCVDYIDAIERIRKEYFNLPEVTVAEGETKQTKGEPENGYDEEGCPGR